MSRSAIQAEYRRSVLCRWLMSSPAQLPAQLIVILAATGPLLVVLFHCFLAAGPDGGVLPESSRKGWIGVFVERRLLDDSLSIAGASLSVYWRLINLSLQTTVLTLIFGFPTAHLIAICPPPARALAATDHDPLVKPGIVTGCSLSSARHRVMTLMLICHKLNIRRPAKRHQPPSPAGRVSGRWA